MKTTFEDKALALRREAIAAIQKSVKRSKEKSKSYDSKCVRVQDFIVGLGGSNLAEVKADELVDEQGFLYDFGSVTTDELVGIADYCVKRTTK